MNALVPVNTAPAMTVSDVERVANAIAKGGLFGSKDPYAVLTLCLVAQAEGQHPAVVFRDYHIINGKPAKKAEAMLRDFLAASGRVEWHALTDEIADATFSHPFGGTARISWDHARAVKAQIAGNAMYKKYPRQMLRSRTISEGVRTVYPGATSGLYESDEVRTFDDVKEPTHDSTTGEIIEGETVDEGDVRDPKIPGITKIRNNLNKLRRDGGKATDLEAFNKLVHGCADDLQKIKDAEHTLWTGMGEDFDGMKAWIKRRREELTPKQESTAFQLLSSLAKECPSTDDLGSLLDEYEKAIADLDGEEARRFDALFNEREEALKAAQPDDMTRAYTQEELRQAARGTTPLEAGAFGG